MEIIKLHKCKYYKELTQQELLLEVALWEACQKISKECNIPINHILHLKTINNLIEHKPQSLNEMSKLKGIESYRLTNFGEIWLKIIEKYTQK